MLQSFFLLFVLSPLIFAESLPHTTITPDVDQILQGSWTVSIALQSSTTLEVDIETQFNEINAVTLVGPTTLVSVVRIKSAILGSGAGVGAPRSRSSAIRNGASGGRSAEPMVTHIAATNVQNGISQAASPSPTSTSPPTQSHFAAASTKSLTITQDQGPYGEDPDSVMANEMDQAYANVTYNPPAYVPVQIPTDACVLWDPSCKGNRTLAADQFFGGGNLNVSGGTMLELFGDSCFDDINAIAEGTKCTSSLLKPADASLSTAAKSYMRQSQCSKDYASVVGGTPRAFEDCCGTCWIYGPNVDVYYWPESNPDTSCLSIIGDSIVPPNEGAQTDAAGVVYWAATTNLYDIYVPTVTTALITTINGVVVKEALANPWDASPSITTTRPVSVPNHKKRISLSMRPRAFNPLYAREQLELNDSMTRASGFIGSTAVSDGFTFTSPSVYVAFYSLSATDMCGFRGRTVSSTMLAFTPGELSTVQGHLWGGGDQIKSTKAFNFADLPCPPMPVMYDDWYKPAPGQPYRLLIALPDKVRSLDPWWTACTEAFYFTGLDPARTLVAETEMVQPTVTAGEPGRTPEPAQPVPDLPSKTGVGTARSTQEAGDPSGNEDLATPNINEGATDPSIGSGSPSTPTIKRVDPPKGAHSRYILPASTSSPVTGLPAVNLPMVQSISPTTSRVNNPSNNKAIVNGVPTIASDNPSSGALNQTPLGSANLLIGGSTIQVTQVTAPVAGEQVHKVGSGAVALNGQTLDQGSPSITVPSIPINSGLSSLVIGTSTISIASLNYAPSSPILRVPEDFPLTQVANILNAYMIAGSTVAPGSSAFVVSGTTYSLDPSGALVVGTSTISLATGASAGSNGALSAGNQIFTPMKGGQAIAISGSILFASGSAITINGTFISLATGGLVVGSSPYAFATPAANAVAATQEVPITTALENVGQSFTANSSAVPIDRTAMTAVGPGVTIGGTPVSSTTGGNLGIAKSTMSPESTSTITAATSARSFKGCAVLAKAPLLTLLIAMLGCITWQLL